MADGKVDCSGILGYGLDSGTALFAFLVDADDALVFGIGADVAYGGGVGGELLDVGDESARDGGVGDTEEADIERFEGPDLVAGVVSELKIGEVKEKI